MLAIGFPLAAGGLLRQRHAGEDAGDDFEHGLRLGGLPQDVGSAARQRERPRFAFAVRRRIEQDGDPGGGRVEAQLPDKPVAIHDRHKDVGDDQISNLGADGGEGLTTIDRLDRPVSLRLQELPETCGWRTGRRRSGSLPGFASRGSLNVRLRDARVGSEWWSHVRRLAIGGSLRVPRRQPGSPPQPHRAAPDHETPRARR